MNRQQQTPERAGASPAAVNWRRLCAAERQIAAQAQAKLDFPIVVPRALPAGYRLTGAELLEPCRTLVTLHLLAPGDALRLTQRTGALSLASELRLTDHPHSTFRLRGKTFFVVAGAFLGEPSDGRWHGTRRSVAWEIDGRICELQQIVARSIPLTTALQIAASCRELPLLTAPGL